MCGIQYRAYYLWREEYKEICKYPDGLELEGHAVVKCEVSEDNKVLTVLSFGGENKHTLLMKYRSVWDENEVKRVKEKEEEEEENKWIAMANTIDNGSNGNESDMEDARAQIGGSNNQFLFVVNNPNHISVFKWPSLEPVIREILPADQLIGGSCFVKTNDNQMLLFNSNIGLSIKYDEDQHRFQYESIPVCFELTYVIDYSFSLLFPSQKKKWTKIKYRFPSTNETLALVTADGMFVHIIGGVNDCEEASQQHLKISIDDVTGKVTFLFLFFLFFFLSSFSFDTKRYFCKKKKKKKMVRLEMMLALLFNTGYYKVA
ncbi:hypothetical protein RFI_21041 [Reticulomyxa filosa]|uniref:Uncharacterized protein n=1 Tax=Reticulomyxa filosa TaxID=46433 RepID=X6MS81_RETFI|nr:hypothetical protein RFI_21041 [Reticulomyxa filosa]|eukprot:ETO16312.1 hypothetical protein RFI_21041 [Reticulomyxa filosa]